VRAEWRPLWQMWHEKRGDETPEDAIVVLKDPQIEGDSHARRDAGWFAPASLRACPSSPAWLSLHDRDQQVGVELAAGVDEVTPLVAGGDVTVCEELRRVGVCRSTG
jgi:hypothetical protein